MRKEKQPLFCHLNKGQVIFLVVSIVLILFVFLVIILGNLSISSLQIGYIFRHYVTLNSLAISGLRYALWQINQNPNFTTSSATVLMPQGSFIYRVSTTTDSNKRLIIVEATLANSLLKKILKATTTIDNTGKILDLEITEE